MNNKITKLGICILEQNQQKVSKFLLKQLLKKQLETTENIENTINQLVEKRIIHPLTENECLNSEMYVITEIENAFPIILETYKETLNPNTENMTSELTNNNEQLKQLKEELTEKIASYQNLNNELANAGIFTRKTPIQEQIKPVSNRINELETKIKELNSDNKQKKSKLEKQLKEKDKIILIDFLLANYTKLINPEIGGTQLMELTRTEGLLDELKKYNLINYSKFGEYLAKPVTDSEKTNPKPYLIQLLKRITK
ncbi:MAG TPA: hypothetical protein VI790_05545 [Candidatus Nanoarchaeia archaeon]|nr:hypothetical protein [Candidatus Nanoarchaeia archaeon]